MIAAAELVLGLLNSMSSNCCGDTTTMRKNAVAAPGVHVKRVSSQNCIVPRPSGPMEYEPVNVRPVFTTLGDPPWSVSSALPTRVPPPAEKLPARAQNSPEGKRPLVLKTKLPLSTALPKTIESGLVLRVIFETACDVAVIVTFPPGGGTGGAV